MKKIIITSGATSEKLDSVRVLTNISSGKLGATIARRISKENILGDNYKIIYIHSKYSELPFNEHLISYLEYDRNINPVEANSVKEVYDAIKNNISDADIVIHCMAVSDFTFNLDNPVKLKSNNIDGFIEYIRANIRYTPKIISEIKKWNPNVFLIGFKFEVGLSEKELIKIAVEAKNKYDGDLVVANDLEEMKREKTHIAYICKSEEDYYKVKDKREIAEAILKEIKK
jgi:phosphopantothenate--cysteine ligase